SVVLGGDHGNAQLRLGHPGDLGREAVDCPAVTDRWLPGELAAPEPDAYPEVQDLHRGWLGGQRERVGFQEKAATRLSLRKGNGQEPTQVQHRGIQITRRAQSDSELWRLEGAEI